MKDWGKAKAEYKRSSIIEAKRCKKCPKPCVLYLWVNYPNEYVHIWFIWPGTRYQIRKPYSRYLFEIASKKYDAKRKR